MIYQKKPLHSVKRALHPIKRALQSIKRALYQIPFAKIALLSKEPYIPFKRALYSIKRALYQVQYICSFQEVAAVATSSTFKHNKQKHAKKNTCALMIK